jgi:hypothetical protein
MFSIGTSQSSRSKVSVAQPHREYLKRTTAECRICIRRNAGFAPE